MNEEVKKLEIEAARIRVQREQLALQREIDSKNRVGAVFETAKTDGNAAVNTGAFILVFCLGALAGGVFWLVIGLFLTFKNTFPSPAEADFMWRLGHTYGSMLPEWSVPLSLLAGVVWIFSRKS